MQACTMHVKFVPVQLAVDAGTAGQDACDSSVLVQKHRVNSKQIAAHDQPHRIACEPDPLSTVYSCPHIAHGPSCCNPSLVCH